MNISTKKTPGRANLLISSVWHKILKIWDTLFEVINIEVHCSKSQVKIFLQQKAAGFGNNIGKEPQEPRPKLKNIYIIYLIGIFALPAIRRKWWFLQVCINSVEERLKFSHIEGSIIPSGNFCLVFWNSSL